MHTAGDAAFTRFDAVRASVHNLVLGLDMTSNCSDVWSFWKMASKYWRPNDHTIHSSGHVGLWWHVSCLTAGEGLDLATTCGNTLWERIFPFPRPFCILTVAASTIGVPLDVELRNSQSGKVGSGPRETALVGLELNHKPKFILGRRLCRIRRSVPHAFGDWTAQLLHCQRTSMMVAAQGDLSTNTIVTRSHKLFIIRLGLALS